MASNIEIVKQTVTSKSRKLKASWSFHMDEIIPYDYVSNIVEDGILWHKLYIFDSKITDWLKSKSTTMWIHCDDVFTWKVADPLYIMMVLKWSK